MPHRILNILTKWTDWAKSRDRLTFCPALLYPEKNWCNNCHNLLGVRCLSWMPEVKLGQLSQSKTGTALIEHEWNLWRLFTLDFLLRINKQWIIEMKSFHLVLFRLHKCLWQRWDLAGRFEMLLTDSLHCNQRQIYYTATNVLKLSPSW